MLVRGDYRHLELLWERRQWCEGAVPVLCAHDELVVEWDQAQAKEAGAWLRWGMQDGMAPLLYPIPGAIDTTVGRAWG